MAVVTLLLAGCQSESSTTQHITQPMNRAQTLLLPPEQWGAIADPVSGIRVDGTNEQGQTLYFFIGANGDSLGFDPDSSVVALDADLYWSPR